MSRIGKDRLKFTADSREDRVLVVRLERLYLTKVDNYSSQDNLSHDVITHREQEMVAKSSATSTSLNAVLCGNWRVGIWRRETRHNQKRREVRDYHL